MYTNSITDRNRALFVIAIDQSGSMAGMIKSGNRVISKAEMVTELANELIAELIERSRCHDGVQDCCDIAIISYSDEDVRLLHTDDDRKWISITDLENRYFDEPIVDREYMMFDGTPQILSYPMRRWIIPSATGSTPMYEAFLLIHEITKQWCVRAENIESIPPFVCNITDGESTDCDYDDLVDIASRIKATSTRCGNTLLFNTHIATNDLNAPEVFPSIEEFSNRTDVPRTLRALFEASSEMPEIYRNDIREIKNDEITRHYKAMSCNCSARELISVLNIGTANIAIK